MVEKFIEIWFMTPTWVKVLYYLVVVALAVSFFVRVYKVMKPIFKEDSQEGGDKLPTYKLIRILSQGIVVLALTSITLTPGVHVQAEVSEGSKETITSEVESVERRGGNYTIKTTEGEASLFGQSVAQEFASGTELHDIAESLKEGDTIKYTVIDYVKNDSFTSVEDVESGKVDVIKRVVDLELVGR